MPQLIAMVIVVVGAMIYMFQTFGGTGDKIEGVAQKASIITEINNIKDGLKIAAKSEQIGASSSGDVVSTLHELGALSYFAEQINEQVVDNNANTTTATPNTYYAISFGGAEITPGGMGIKLVATQNFVPGIFVDLTVGNLKDNAAFLESQIANDLSAVAYIDRNATSTTDVGTTAQDTASGATGILTRIPADKAVASSDDLKDGTFVIYYKDFGSDEVVK